MDIQIQKEQAKKFLQSHYLATITTVAHDGEPQAATMLYLMDDDFNFYFVTRRHTRKYANLQSNNKVGMVITSTDNPETIQVQGEATTSPENLDDEFVAQLEKKTDLANLYHGPFLGLAGLDFSVWKIKTHWLRSLNVQEGEEAYHQIIPEK